MATDIHKITAHIQCHGTDHGETWECALMRDGVRLAFVTRLSSHAQARDAAEYLQFGIASEWQVMPTLDADMQAAGVEALKNDRKVVKMLGEYDSMTVSAVWSDMIAAWCRKMRAAAGLE